MAAAYSEIKPADLTPGWLHISRCGDYW